MDKVKARSAINELVQKFKEHQDVYESSEYLERQLQTDFLDDFFKVLGWDLTNKANLAPHLREVLVEKGDTKGRPDYTFRVNGTDRFFVEAKPPSKGTDRPEDIFQAKSYGYSTKSVSIAILTDFKTLKVFDTGIKPDIKKPRLGLLLETDLSKISKDDFNQIWVFSHDEVHNDSLEQLLLKYPALKRLRIPVDVTFFEQLTIWREDLAKEVYKKNPDITVRSLNDVVQRLLDRLIFIRLLEDREIIKSRRLKDIADNWRESRHRDIQPELNALFKKLNNDFNGEIFKPHPCETMGYDSKIIADIIDELYPPKSAYDFSVIGVELLGIIYEKYLGKTIRLTEKRLKVEEKPEVRKAGGVYYTPKWVVDYIVDNTVGDLIYRKTPEEITKLRFLDPACGSGSFLIGILSELFSYHLDYYLTHIGEAREGTLFPKIIRAQNTEPRLSIYAKSNILKNNIFGVDLDPQAVEITMMSLYIKVLEGERALPENKELLPSLSNNIRCGNSLIGFDFVSQQTLLEDSEKEKTNPFEWRSAKTGFGKIIGEKEGFHAIVGNPPYIRIQTMREWAPKEVDYITNKYKTAETGNFDIYVVFVEKAIDLLDKNGLFGYILPHKFFQAEYGHNLREIISKGKLLMEIVTFTEQQVFEEATTYTCLLFLSKSDKKKFKYTEIKQLNNPVKQLDVIKRNINYKDDTLNIGTLPITKVTETPWQFRLGSEDTLLEKLKGIKPILEDISKNIFVGTQTSADDVFVLENSNVNGNYVTGFSKSLDKEVRVELSIVKPFLKGREIRKFISPTLKCVLICPYEIESDQFRLLSEKELSTNCPFTYKYLSDNKPELMKREKGRFKGQNWYAFGYPKSMILFQIPKIIVPDYNNSPSFTFDGRGHFYKTGYGIILKEGFSYNYILGLLNSKLLFKFLSMTGTKLRGGYVRFWTQFIKNLPIIIPTSNKEKEIESGIDNYVAKILSISNKKFSIFDTYKIEMLEREISVYEEKIDELVYELYGLSEEEKKVIS